MTAMRESNATAIVMCYFTGATAWNVFECFEETQTVLTGGTRFGFELACNYGIRMGAYAAFGADNAGVYIQVGRGWARPGTIGKTIN